MVTGVLHHWGVILGRQIKGPSVNNQKGFFENIPAMRLDHKIMESFGLRWDSLAPLPQGWRDKEGGGATRKMMGDILDQEFEGASMIAMKDPLLCRLFSIWEPLLVERFYQMRFLIPYRHPMNVARSLEKRDRIPLEKGLALWKIYVEESLKNSESGPRYFFNYDAFFKNPKRDIRSLHRFVEPPRNYQDSLVDLNEFISADLRHHQEIGFENIGDPDVLALYNRLIAYEHEQEKLESSFFSE